MTSSHPLSKSSMPESIFTAEDVVLLRGSALRAYYMRSDDDGKALGDLADRLQQWVDAHTPVPCSCPGRDAQACRHFTPLPTIDEAELKEG